MITLTAPNGEKVLIDPKSIAEIFPNANHIYHPSAKSVLVLNSTHGGEHQAVIESMDEVEALIKG